MYFVPGQPVDQGPPSLRTALATIHRDPAWWQKMLIGGLIALTGIGVIVVEGYQIESLDNTRNGFPTPLPRWRDWSLKAIQGLFGLIIDFFYFVFPLLVGGLVLGCGAIGVAVFGGAPVLRLVGSVVVGSALVWIAAMWLLGVSAVAKQLYVSEGVPRDALSSKVLRTVLGAEDRRVYAAARLQSALPYLLPLVLLGGAWYGQRWSGWVALVLAWLGLAALLYARLVAVQVYQAATGQRERRQAQQRRAARR